MIPVSYTHLDVYKRQEGKLTQANNWDQYPDANGRFGQFGGRFVAETLMPNILALNEAYEATKKDPEFQKELDGYLKHFVGRPSPLYFAERLTEHYNCLLYTSRCV